MKPWNFARFPLNALLPFFALLSGCLSSSSPSDASTQAQPEQEVALSIHLGPVGALARTAQMDPKRLILKFTSPQSGMVTDTIAVSGSGQILKSYNLPAAQTWSLQAQGRDQRDSLLYSGTTQFFLRAGVTTQLNLSLDSRYSSFVMRLPLHDSLTRIRLIDNGRILIDTVMTAKRHSSDTALFERDYLATSAQGGVSGFHTFSMQVYGILFGSENLLYSMPQTHAELLPGAATIAPFQLDWVGSTTPPPGKAEILATLGLVGILKAEVTYTDTTGGNYAIPWNPAVSYGTVIDVRDGQLYRTVRIGSQNWFAQNLNYLFGRPNPPNEYGLLYAWTATMNKPEGLCPNGWHVPSLAEWDTLWKFSKNRHDNLKARWVWKDIGGELESNSDSLGFRILPAGISGVSFPNGREGAYFWSASTDSSGNPIPVIFETSYGFPGEDFIDRTIGLSVRCLQD